MYPPLSAAVLAGGASRRMGVDKALVRLGPDEPPVIALVLRAIIAVAGDVFVVAPERPGYRELGVRIVPDVEPGLGPLGGIATALTVARHEHCLIVSCDLPFLNSTLLAWMAALPRDYEVLVPVLGSGDNERPIQPQPLHAIYSRACLGAVHAQLATGDLRPTRLLDRVDARLVGEDEIRALDPELRSFYNMNSPVDARSAARLAAGSEPDRPVDGRTPRLL